MIAWEFSHVLVKYLHECKINNKIKKMYPWDEFRKYVIIICT